MKIIKRFFTDYEAVIGLEVHSQLSCSLKLFSNAPFNHYSAPNSNVAFFDAAIPGTLPILNPESIKLACKAAMVLNSTISKKITFDRKHYFYPDLPNGYQINKVKVGFRYFLFYFL